MQRIYREIARDVARITSAHLAQLLVLRRRDGGMEAETLALDGLALAALPLRTLATELLAREPGHGPAVPLLDEAGPPRRIVPCEATLSGLLGPSLEPGTPPLQSVFLLLTRRTDEAKVLRLVLSGRQRGTALRALDALARFAAARIEAESFRREIAGRDAIYRDFQEGAGEAIAVADAADGRVMEGNRRMCELTGRTRVELRRLTLG
jgi:PAS domain-containing protein